MRCWGLSWCKSDTDVSWTLLPSHGKDAQKNSIRSSTRECILVMLSPEAAAVMSSCKTTWAKSSESYSRQCILTQEALLECLWKAPETIRQWQQFLCPLADVLLKCDRLGLRQWPFLRELLGTDRGDRMAVPAGIPAVQYQSLLRNTFTWCFASTSLYFFYKEGVGGQYRGG